MFGRAVLPLRRRAGLDRDIASVADLCARPPRFRAGRRRLAGRDRRRALPRFHLRRRRQCAGTCPSASGRGAHRAGAKSSGTSPTSTKFPKPSASRSGCATRASPTWCSSAIPAPRRWNARSRRRANTTRRAAQPERYRIITFEGAFHGRTLATLAAGGQKKYLDGFGPVVEGFDQVPFGDLEATKRAIGAETAAIMIEPMMGEGGVRVVEPSFLRALARAVRPARPAADLRRSADRHGAHRRIVRLSAHRRRRPTSWRSPRRSAAAFRSARASPPSEAAKGMTAGTHGSTFGGNPLAMSAANAMLDVMLAPGFLDHVKRIGLLLQAAAGGDQRPLSVGDRRGARRRPAGRPACRSFRPASLSMRCAPRRCSRSPPATTSCGCCRR